MKIQYREFTRPSACGEGEVFSRSWQPDAAPRAIIQIAHGMQEHAGRYDRFARDVDYLIPCTRTEHAFAAGAAMLALEQYGSRLLETQPK